MALVFAEIKATRQTSQLKSELKAQKKQEYSAEDFEESISVKSDINDYYDWAERELSSNKKTLMSDELYSKQFDREKKRH